MFLSTIKLTQYKNHPQTNVQFVKKISCVIGNNGVGKTNLLDAVYLLCLTKSYFNTTDQQTIQFGAEFLRVDGYFLKSGESYSIVCKLQQGKKKDFSVNEVPYPRLNEHVGNFPCIFITPNDVELIVGGSEERRKYLDNTISQTDKKYLEHLILYNKILQQRNACLKQFAESGRIDETLLQSYNTRLVESGEAIYKKRVEAVALLQPLFQRYYSIISLERDSVRFDYTSHLHSGSFSSLLEKNVKRDVILERTEFGIHKDDLEIVLNDTPARKFGSQGQQKSVLIAMKLAQYDFIRQSKSFKPLLMIDDIFDKLDMDRSAALLELIATENFGQVLLSHTSSDRLELFIKNNPEIIELIYF